MGHLGVLVSVTGLCRPPCSPTLKREAIRRHQVLGRSQALGADPGLSDLPCLAFPQVEAAACPPGSQAMLQTAAGRVEAGECSLDSAQALMAVWPWCCCLTALLLWARRGGTCPGLPVAGHTQAGPYLLI